MSVVETLSMQCKEAGIPIIWDDKQKFFFNQGDFGKIKELYDDLVKKGHKLGIYVAYADEQINYTPVDDTYNPFSV